MRKIALIAWAVYAALYYGDLANDRVEIKFNPETDGPIRYAAAAAPRAPSSSAGGYCVTMLSYTAGPQGTAVVTPCPTTTISTASTSSSALTIDGRASGRLSP